MRKMKYDKRARAFITGILSVIGVLAMFFSPCVPRGAKVMAAEEKKFYRVSGKEILDPEGNPTLIKGMSFGNNVYGNPLTIEDGVINNHDESSYRELAEMGFDHIRFVFNYGLFEDDSAPYQYKEEGFQWFDQNIKWAKKYGLHLKLQMSYPQGGYQEVTSIYDVENDQMHSGGKALWMGEKAEENQNRFVALWGAIAERYRDEPTITGYGLLGEPVVLQKDTAEETVAQWQQLAQRIADEIRKVDNNHILFIQPVLQCFHPTDFSKTDWSMLTLENSYITINDSNAVYEIQYYEPLKFTHQGAEWMDGMQDVVMTYPSSELIENNTDFSKWKGMVDSAATSVKEGDWTYFETDSFAATEEYNFANLELRADSIGEGAYAYFDDVKLVRYNEAGESEEIASYDFADTEINSDGFWTNGEAGTVSLSKTEGHSEMGSVCISGVKRYGVYNLDAFHLKKGYTYKLSGWVKSVDAQATARPSASFYFGDTIYELNKDFLEYKLKRFLKFREENNVPMMVSEYGLIRGCFGRGDEAYFADISDLFKKYNLGTNCHGYHDKAFGLYPIDGWAPRGERNEELYRLLTTYFVTPRVLDIEEPEYSITYKNMDGAANASANPVKYTKDTADITLSAPTKTGYDFLGWYTDEAMTNAVSGMAIAKGSTGEKVFYAKWTPTVYVVTYHLDGGANAASNPKEYTVESDTFTLAAPARDGYAFEGWYSDEALTKKVTEIAKGTMGDLEFYAKWQRRGKYSIFYQLNGGTNAAANPVRYDDTVTPIRLEDPERTGYDFAGWYSDSAYSKKVTALKDTDTGNVVLRAKWTAHKYKISFNKGAFDATGKISALTNRAYDTAYELPANKFTRKDHVFLGWGLTENGTDVDFRDREIVKNLTADKNGSVKLYARWLSLADHKAYGITYRLNGGVNHAENPAYYTEGTAVVLKDPERSGYKFEGWYTKSNLTQGKTEGIAAGSTGKKTFYAKWSALKYTIKFNANPTGITSGNSNASSGVGGVVDKTMDDITGVKIGSKITLKNKFVYPGYTFQSWNTKPDGSGRTYKIKTGVKDLAIQENGSFADSVTLYAQWTETKYTITYNLNKGKWPKGTKYAKSYTISSDTITLAEPTRKGYTFEGWYTTSRCKDGTEKATIETGSKGKVTLYAKWKAKK